MKRVFRAATVLLALLLCSQAAAAEKAGFVVLPFAIQGPQGFAYLERSIPQMLTSRLYWKGHVEPVVNDVPASQPAVSDEAAAEKARVKYKADYVVWGTVTVMGDTCSLDVRVRDASGKIWPQAREAKTNQLITAIRAVSDHINSEVFKRAPEKAAAAAQEDPGAGRINQMNPDLMMNETSSKEVYLNPEFRYAGASSGDDARLRSQALPFAAIGMEVVDADNDGKNEIFLLDDHVLRAYRFTPGKLEPLGEYKFPMTSECLSLRSFERRGNYAWLVVNVIDSDKMPMSAVLTFDGHTFKEEAKNIRYFLNVVKMAPDYMPMLIGQQSQPPRLFRPGVYELIKVSKGFTTGKRLDLPKDANVFNFTCLPARRDEPGGEKIIVLGENEHLRTYTPNGMRLAETDETYSGSSKGIEISANLPGLGQDTVLIGSMFYIPERMLAMDLERDGNYELVVNRPISTASTIFERYRFFPQSEIHSLFWDGVGLNLQWKTRRIKGAVTDFTIADANNDGVLDLAVAINTHPGALGVQTRKTMVMLYPLDLSKTDSKTQPSRDEIYQ